MIKTKKLMRLAAFFLIVTMLVGLLPAVYSEEENVTKEAAAPAEEVTEQVPAAEPEPQAEPEPEPEPEPQPEPEPEPQPEGTGTRTRTSDGRHRA